MKVGVIGAGTMGSGIAQAFAQTEGYEVMLCDINDTFAANGKNKIAKGFEKRIAKGKMTQEAADKINHAKESGHRVIAVGTTSTRTMEAAADENGKLHECSGWTEIFIYPGYQFKVIDALITNFHLPESTLVMLVSALAGREHILAAYEEAVKERYRFFSFGDAMFIQ